MPEQVHVMQETWTTVDRYFASLFVPPDAVLDTTLKASEHAGLPAINVSPPQGKLLHLLARIHGAKRILEIGTLGGYSTIWMARALPADGRLITLEASESHAEVARANIARAHLDAMVEVRIGKALDTLPELEAEGLGPFDLVFIDADKENIPHYFEWSLRLARVGTMIIVDNVVRDGEVANPESTDPRVLGVRRFNDMASAEPRVSVTAIQTVGSKGYDGFALAVVIK